MVTFETLLNEQVQAFRESQNASDNECWGLYKTMLRYIHLVKTIMKVDARISQACKDRTLLFSVPRKKTQSGQSYTCKAMIDERVSERSCFDPSTSA